MSSQEAKRCGGSGWLSKTNRSTNLGELTGSFQVSKRCPGCPDCQPARQCPTCGSPDARYKWPVSDDPRGPECDDPCHTAPMPTEGEMERFTLWRYWRIPNDPWKLETRFGGNEADVERLEVCPASELERCRQERDEWVGRFKQVAEYQRAAIARAERLEAAIRAQPAERAIDVLNRALASGEEE